MYVNSDEGFVSIIAENDAEAALLAPIAEAINKTTRSPVCLTDNCENGDDHRIINGILQIERPD